MHIDTCTDLLAFAKAHAARALTPQEGTLLKDCVRKISGARALGPCVFVSSRINLSDNFRLEFREQEKAQEFADALIALLRSSY